MHLIFTSPETRQHLKLILQTICFCLLAHLGFAQYSISDQKGPLPNDPNSGYIEITAATVELGPFQLTMNGNDLGTFISVHTVPDLSVGTYNFIITDAAGCETDLSVSLEFECSLELLITGITNPSFCNISTSCIETCQENGSITFDVSGANNYQLYLNNELVSSNTTVFNNLSKRRYFIKVVDPVSNCEVFEEILLSPCSTRYENEECRDAIGGLDIEDLPDLSSIFVSIGRVPDSSTGLGKLRVGQYYDPQNQVTIKVKDENDTYYDITDLLPPGQYTVILSNGCETEIRSVQLNCTLSNTVTLTNDSGSCSTDQLIVATAPGLDLSNRNVFQTRWFEHDNFYDDIYLGDDGALIYEENEFFNPGTTQVSMTDRAVFTGKNLVFELLDYRNNCTTTAYYSTPVGGYASIDTIQGVCPYDQFGLAKFNYNIPQNSSVTITDHQNASIYSDVLITPKSITIRSLAEGTHPVRIKLGGCVYDFNIKIEQSILEKVFQEYDEDSDRCIYRFSCNDELLPPFYDLAEPPTTDNFFTNASLDFSFEAIVSQFLGGLGSIADVVGLGFFGNLIRSIDGTSCNITKTCEGSTLIFNADSNVESRRVHEYRFLLNFARSRTNSPINGAAFDEFWREVGDSRDCDVVIFCKDSFEPIRVTSGQAGIFRETAAQPEGPCSNCGRILANCSPSELIADFFPEETIIPCVASAAFVYENLSSAIYKYQNNMYPPAFNGTDLHAYLETMEQLVDFENGVGNCLYITYCSEDYSELIFPTVSELVNYDCFTDVFSKINPRCSAIISEQPLLCDIVSNEECKVTSFCGIFAVNYKPATMSCTYNLAYDIYRDPSCGEINLVNNSKQLKSNSNQQIFETRSLRINLSHDEHFLNLQPMKSVNAVVPDVVCQIGEEKYLIKNKHNSSNVFYNNFGSVDQYYEDIIDEQAVVSFQLDNNEHGLLISNDDFTTVRKITSTFLDNNFTEVFLDKIQVSGIFSGSLYVDDEFLFQGISSNNYSYIIEFDFQGNIIEHKEYALDFNNFGVKNFSNSDFILTGIKDANTLIVYKQDLSNSLELLIPRTGIISIEDIESTQNGFVANFSGSGSISFNGEVINIDSNNKIIAFDNDGTYLWEYGYAPSLNVSLEYSFARNSIFASFGTTNYNSSIQIIEFNPIKLDILSAYSLTNIPAEVSVKELYIDDENFLYFGGELKSDNEMIPLGAVEYINKNSPDRQLAFVSYIELDEKVDIYSSEYVYNDRDCHTDLIIDSPFALNNHPDNHYVESNGSITAKSVIAQNTNLTLDAYTRIKLEFPFITESGVRFKAVIDGCSGVAR